ncbi:MAG: hypothetical protein COA50_10210 [Flavobacteriaceae bacterium]|nr:MAG: hypothetical protein COA50_10210 [Flavobacteriaceae bacterium]
MLKFFGKIRQRLLTENKFSKYLLYAIGEIILVVIGILIALSINNWNEQQKNRVTEQKLLIAMQEDLLVNIDRLNKDILLEQRTINQATKIINHLDERKPYNPSLDVIFSEAIYSPDILISATSYEFLKFNGIDIILSESLQRSIINLFDVVYANLVAETVRLENQFWPSSVLPMIHKHFRETEFRKLKPTNYEALMDDTTYKNMVMHRVHFRKLALELKAKALIETEELVEILEKELDRE